MERDAPPATDSPRLRTATRSASDAAVWLLRKTRTVVIFVIGMTVLLIGVVMIVAPGPATIVIPAGLAILATEFVWARRWLEYARRQVKDLANRTVANGTRGARDGEKPPRDA